MKHTLKKSLAIILAAATLLCCAPLSGIADLDLPEFGGFKKLADSVSEFFDGFATKAEAATEYTSGYYSYTIDVNGNATITDFSTSAKGEITIPSTLDGYLVTSIDFQAFAFCNFTSIIIPDCITSIGDWAFRECDDLMSVDFGNGMKNIGSYAFFDCSSLTSVIIPDSVTSIGSGAFCRCSNLTSVIIGNGVTKISSYSFQSCGRLSSVTIPDCITNIGDAAFEFCYSLTSVTLPESMTSIGHYAFYECDSLAGITIPDGVTNIGDSAFAYCSCLTKIIVDDLNRVYSNDEYGVLYNKDKTILIQYPGGNVRISYTIPDGVTSIGNSAFEHCDSLASIRIPDSVTSIGKKTFYYCDSLTSVTIGSGLTSIPEDAFYFCGSLTSVTIPEGVTSIGDSAFAHCESLARIEIPNSVTSIGDGTFEFCYSLANVMVGNGLTYIDSCAFKDCLSLVSITIPNSVTAIGASAFSSCSSLTNVIIPNGVRTMSYKTFYNCTNLINITIPNSVTIIEDCAFECCVALSDVYYTSTANKWEKIIIGKNNTYILNATLHFGTTDISFDKESYVAIVNKELVINGEITAEVDDISKIDLSYTVSDPTGLTVISDSINVINADKAEFTVTVKGLKEGEYILTATDGIVLESCIVKVSEISEIELKIEDTEDVFYEFNGFLFDQFGNYAENSINIDIQLRNKLKDGVDIFSLDSETLANARIEDVKFTASVSYGYGFDLKGTQRVYEKKFDSIEFNATEKNPIKIYLAVSSPEVLTIEYKLYIGGELKHTEEAEIEVISYKENYVNEHINALSLPEYSIALNSSFAREMISAEDKLSYKWNKVLGRSLFSNIYDLIDGDLSEQMAYELLLSDLIGKIYEDEMVSKKSVELFGDEMTDVSKKIADVLSDFCEHYRPDLDQILKEIGDGDLYSQAVAAFIRGETDNDFSKVFRECVTSNQLRMEIKASLNALSTVDKITEVLDLAEIALDSYNGYVKAFNLVSSMNTFAKMDEELIFVLKRMLTDCTQNPPLEKAINAFINYYNSENRIDDIINEYLKLNLNTMTKTLWSALKAAYKNSVKETIIGKLAKTFGQKMAENAVSVIGGALSGYQLGSLLSNLLCNTKSVSDKMAKVVAMGKFSTVLKETVYSMWNQLDISENYQLARNFDMALKLYVEVEKYAYSETAEALRLEGSSVMVNLFCKDKHDDYIEQISEYIIKIAKLDSLKCHSDNLARIAADISQLDSGVSDYSIDEKEYKVVCVRCPVDVEIRKGTDILVSIVDNETKYCAEGIKVIIFEGEKYICLPADAEYDVNITATDNGTMNYDVYEFDKSGEKIRSVAYNNIVIADGQKFNGSVNSELLTDSSNYNLETDGKEIYASKDTENGDENLHEAQVKIGSEEIIRNVPSTLNLVHTNLPDNAKITWSSDNKSVVIKPAEDGMSCEIIAGKVEDISVKATVEYGTKKTVAEKSFNVKEQDFKVTWKIGEEKRVQNVEYGENIIVPEVSLPEGYIFVGWDKEIPETMPAYDLVFTAAIETDPNYHFHTVKTVTVPATCTEDGVEYDICETCGEKLTEDIILPSIGHIPGSWVTSIAPSCTDAGEKIAHCTVCGQICANDIIPATGHIKSSWITTKAATCTAEGERVRKCVYCGEVMETEKTPITAHTPGNWSVSVNPTCTEKGEKVRRCTDCGILLETVEMPMLSHTPGSWITVLEPTTTAEGKMVRKCTACGVVLEEKTIPVIEDDITVEIRTPSRTTINYGDSIILHAEVDGVMPAGYTLNWGSSNGNFSVEPNGDTCKITPVTSGDTTITLILADENGTPVDTAKQTMTAKAGFFDKIIAFFKKLFRLTKTYPEIFGI